MKYPLSVSNLRSFGSDSHDDPHASYRNEYGPDNTPSIRRFPPVLQFLTRVEQVVESQLQTVAHRAFQEGKSLDQICSAVYQAGLTLGYTLTIGLQEVYSSRMPSFPKETVMTCLIMIDFTPTRTRATS